MTKMTVIPDINGGKLVRVEGVDTPIPMGTAHPHIFLGPTPGVQGPNAVDYLAAALAG